MSFSALLTCRHVGMRPAAMIEPGPRVTVRWPTPLLPRALGVPLRLGTELRAIEGRERVEAVVVRGPGEEERIEADGGVVTGLFRPEAALLAASHPCLDPRTGGPEVDEFGRCSDPAFFAAGNLLRTVETAGWWSEGRAVADAMLRARDLPVGPARRGGGGRPGLGRAPAPRGGRTGEARPARPPASRPQARAGPARPAR